MINSELISSNNEKSEKEFAVFTVCNVAYLPKALVLAESLLHNSNTRLKIFIFDERRPLEFGHDLAEIFWVDEIGCENWRKLAFIYDITEFSTSLKPFIASKILEEYNQVIFLDPDTMLFSSIECILIELNNASILLTPHYTTPQPSTITESDQAMMRFGSFNLGFFALKRDKEVEHFLEWWSRRCFDLCFMESQFGLSTDQKWISIAPCFYQGLKIIFDPGYNMAAWNTFEREINKVENGKYYVNDKYLLKFFHFSNFDHDDPQYVNARASCEYNIQYPYLQEIGENYSVRLKHFESLITNVRYSFDFMSNGWYISPTLRRAYAAVFNQLPIHDDPFDSNSIIMSFAKKNFLISKNTTKYKTVKNTLGNKKNYNIILRIINIPLKFILFILGPNKFFDFLKLLNLLSSARLNNNLFKISNLKK